MAEAISSSLTRITPAAPDSTISRDSEGGCRHAMPSANVSALCVDIAPYILAGCDVYSQSTTGGEYLKITCSDEPAPLEARQALQ